MGRQPRSGDRACGLARACRLAHREGAAISTPLPPIASGRPFRGGFRGATWNAQALFSTDPERQEAKQRVLMGVASSHDFVMVQETHSTDGALHAWRQPAGYEYFYSHGSNTVAGIGILVDKQFLQQFTVPVSRCLEEVIPGRAGILRLSGAKGRVDLVVVYAPTGDAATARAELREQLSRAIVPAHHALTVIAGDWNYTSTEEDRYYVSPFTWTGGRQATEEVHFQQVLGQPFDLVEFDQTDYTNQSVLGRARLDRAYANFGHDAQLDHQIACVALPWPGRHISTHRPLSFRFIPPQQHTDAHHRPLPEDVVKSDEWRRRVKLRHRELLHAEMQQDNLTGIRRLVLLKRAMRDVASSIQRERDKNRGAPEEDRLSGLIRTLRAWDQGRMHVVRRVAARWDLSLRLQAAYQWSEDGEKQLGAVRKEVLELPKKALVEDMRVQHEQERDMPDAQRAAKRQQLMVRLKRLRPGASTTLQAVRDASGEVHQDAKSMATALKAHWARVFAGLELKPEDMERWMLEAYLDGQGLDKLPPPESSAWKVRRRDIARAVRLAGKSAPGPDGIPYCAWQSLQDYGVDCLWDVMQELSSADITAKLEAAYHDEEACTFNLGLLACIPKQTTGVTADGTQVCAVEDTRPISMVDTANRLLANSARLRWEPYLGEWISPDQRGFLPNRSLLTNVIDLEEEAMTTSLYRSEGAVVLLDFAAAFPSISQTFLKVALRKIGFPPCALNILDSLYYQNHCRIQIQGSHYPGFPMTAGIRQGCPLSPLLFVTAMDGLIRIITRRVRGARVRAFADDTAVVLQDLKGDLPTLRTIFDELQQAAGLRLNVKKCVLIPLGDRGPPAVQAYLERTGSMWFGVQVALHGKYLGFVIGPGKSRLTWIKPLQKARERVSLWDWSQLGLFYATQVYITMVLSLFSFASQLECPPAEVLAAETALLRKVAPGAGGWCRQSELHNLKQGYHFAGEFKDVTTTTAAAQLRVAHYENRHHGGLRLHQREAALDAAQRETQYVDRSWRLREWYTHAPTVVLQDTIRRLRHQGVTMRRVEDIAAGGLERPWNDATTRKVRNRFQKTARELIQAQSRYDAEEWTRRKLGKWGLHDRREATRCLERVRGLATAVPPRVMAAAIGCVWSRWPTARRFQNRDSECLLGCGFGEDSIKHYACCRRTRGAARKWLGIEYRISAPHQHWAFAAPSCVEVESHPGWWARIALLQYAVYRTTNAERSAAHRRDPMSEEFCMQSLRQGLIEGARNHLGAKRLLRSWASRT